MNTPVLQHDLELTRKIALERLKNFRADESFRQRVEREGVLWKD